jgi:glutathione S-transferase
LREAQMAYQLYYWNSIQGRGEFVRLALEEAAADYVDITRHEGSGMGTEAMFQLMESGAEKTPPFAPPFLKDGDLLISHVANILFYLGPKLGLAPADAALRYTANGLQLTITDFISEVHDTHHPISTGLYYEDQKAEAKARSAAFISDRIPKYLGYFERVLQRNSAGPLHIVGDEISYVDLSLFQVIEGLNYAFPNAMKSYAERYIGLAALHAAVRERPQIVAYLSSPRRLAFNEDGIFRHYTELDLAD